MGKRNRARGGRSVQLRPSASLLATYCGAVPTLLEVIAHLGEIAANDGYSPGPTIYAQQPWTISSDALVLSGDDCPDGVATESGHDYLLEVDLAREAVEVWSAWRVERHRPLRRRRWP